MPNSQSTYELLLFIIIASISIAVLAVLVYRIVRNPFRYPYFVQVFDVSSKRNIRIEDYIDRFLSDPENWYEVQDHERVIAQWKEDCQAYIDRCILKEHRTRQYEEVLDDRRAYRFQTVRQQTRYHQQNYVKTSCKVDVTDGVWAVNWEWLLDRYRELEAIGFEATLHEYDTKNQRKLMTPALRRQIMERDGYTCQLCGKYMPDEVGLHIDHILPVARGGKSVPSNLRVLCSKCNGSKGAK